MAIYLDKQNVSGVPLSKGTEVTVTPKLTSGLLIANIYDSTSANAQIYDYNNVTIKAIDVSGDPIATISYGATSCEISSLTMYGTFTGPNFIKETINITQQILSGSYHIGAGYYLWLYDAYDSTITDDYDISVNVNGITIYNSQFNSNNEFASGQIPNSSPSQIMISLSPDTYINASGTNISAAKNFKAILSWQSHADRY